MIAIDGTDGVHCRPYGGGAPPTTDPSPHARLQSPRRIAAGRPPNVLPSPRGVPSDTRYREDYRAQPRPWPPSRHFRPSPAAAPPPSRLPPTTDPRRPGCRWPRPEVPPPRLSDGRGESWRPLPPPPPPGGDFRPPPWFRGPPPPHHPRRLPPPTPATAMMCSPLRACALTVRPSPGRGFYPPAAAHWRTVPARVSPSSRARPRRRPGLDADAERLAVEEEEEREWRRHLSGLRAYKALVGDCTVPETGHGWLGDFARRMRKEHRQWKAGETTTLLSAERRMALDRIGFTWEDARARRKVDPVVLRKSPFPEGTTRRRKGSQRGESENDDEEELLDLGSDDDDNESGDDNATSIRDDSWFPFFLQDLQTYRSLVGHCVVPNRGTGRLCVFVRLQQEEYGRWRRGETEQSLTEERRRALRAVGFVWETPADEGIDSRNGDCRDGDSEEDAEVTPADEEGERGGSPNSRGVALMPRRPEKSAAVCRLRNRALTLSKRRRKESAGNSPPAKNSKRGEQEKPARGAKRRRHDEEPREAPELKEDGGAAFVVDEELRTASSSSPPSPSGGGDRALGNEVLVVPGRPRRHPPKYLL